MADNKNDKPSAENGVSTDTGQVFDKLFRDELDALEDDQQEKPAPKTDATKRKVIKKKHASAVNRDAPEEVSPKKGAKMKKIEMDKTGSQPKISGGSDKIKIALLCVVLVAAVAFIINSLGIVNFGGLLGFSEPTRKKESNPVW